MTNSNGEAEINPRNVEFAELDIQTKTILADNIRKTRHKWVINDFIKYSNGDLIILFIMNIGAKSSIHMEKSFIIHHYQIDKLDCLDLGNIHHISEDIISL